MNPAQVGVVPHVLKRQVHQRPLKNGSQRWKGLFQQYRSEVDIDGLSRQVGSWTRSGLSFRILTKLRTLCSGGGMAAYSVNSSISVLATFRSRMSKPSVNEP
jgi:hypothetical protein